jgi:hypothetical protein
MNASTEMVSHEFLSWINEQLRSEVEKRAVHREESRMQWVVHVHAAVVTGLSCASIAILMYLQC